MEKWKIGVIVALLLGLVGYGIVANKEPNQELNSSPTPSASPTPSRYLGKTIGPGEQQLPEWGAMNTWMNTPKPIPLGSLKGSVSLVEVFRIQCPHCQDAAPMMQKLYERYQPRGFKMVAVQSPGDYKNLENPEIRWNDVQTWVKERQLKYPIGFDKDSQWFQGKMKGDYYPTILVFDKSGKAVLAFTGHDNEKFINLAVTLEKLLPSKGTLNERALNLAKWLNSLLQPREAAKDPVLNEAMADDLKERLK